MEKKLTSQGPKGRESYTLTLPKKWVTNLQLDKTKKVDLEIIGNKIIIADKNPPPQKSTLDMNSYKSTLHKTIPAMYKLGIKEIKFANTNTKISEEISKIIRNKLIGFETIEHKKNYLIVSEIVKESEEDFKTILRRIFLLLLEFNKNPKSAKMINQNINRLYNYCQKTLIKKGHTEFQKIPFYFLLLDQLEKIADEFEWILETKRSNEEKSILNEITNLLEGLYQVFYKFDAEKYSKVQKRTFELKQEIKLSNKINLATMNLHNLARLLNSLSGTIFAIKLDQKTN